METKKVVVKTTRIVCLFGLVGISGFTSVLAQEIDNQEQTITGHTIVEDWSRSEDFYLVNFSTSRSVPGGEFLAFVSKDILDDDVTVVSLFWHDDYPSGEDARDRVLAQARLVGQNNDYLVRVRKRLFFFAVLPVGALATVLSRRPVSRFFVDLTDGYAIRGAVVGGGAASPGERT